MKYWRFAALLSASIAILLVIAGIIIYKHRSEFSFLFVNESSFPAARTPKKPPHPKTAAELPAPVQEIAPEKSAGAKVLSIENIKVLPYEGRNGAFLPVITASAGLEGSLSASAKILGGGGFVYPAAGDRLEIAPVDGLKLSSGSPYEIVPPDGSSPARILLPAEQLALRYYPPEELMASAVAEALMALRSRSFAEAPEFFRRGLALYVSGLGGYYEKRFILKADREPQQMILPLTDDSSCAWANGFWAVNALRDSRGQEGVAALIREVLSGRDWKGALEAASGESFELFGQRYRKYALNYLSVLTSERSRFRKAVDMLRRINEEEGYPLLVDFVKNHPTDLYAGDAAYYLHYAEYRLGRPQKAIDGFQDLLNNAPYSTSSQGKAHYFLGRSYELKGFRTLAMVEYRLAELEDNDLLRKAGNMRLRELEK